MQTKREMRGGYREGSGRKSRLTALANGVTATHIAHMIEIAEEFAEATGKTIDHVLISIIYSKSTEVREKLAAIKIYKEFTIGKYAQEKEAEAEAAQGPQFYLPERRPDPAKIKAMIDNEITAPINGTFTVGH